MSKGPAPAGFVPPSAAVEDAGAWGRSLQWLREEEAGKGKAMALLRHVKGRTVQVKVGAIDLELRWMGALEAERVAGRLESAAGMAEEKRAKGEKFDRVAEAESLARDLIRTATALVADGSVLAKDLEADMDAGLEVAMEILYAAQRARAKAQQDVASFRQVQQRPGAR